MTSVKRALRKSSKVFEVSLDVALLDVIKYLVEGVYIWSESNADSGHLFHMFLGSFKYRLKIRNGEFDIEGYNSMECIPGRTRVVLRPHYDVQFHSIRTPDRPLCPRVRYGFGGQRAGTDCTGPNSVEEIYDENSFPHQPCCCRSSR